MAGKESLLPLRLLSEMTLEELGDCDTKVADVPQLAELIRLVEEFREQAFYDWYQREGRNLLA